MKGHIRIVSLVIALAAGSATLAMVPAGAASQNVTVTPTPSSVNVGQTAHLTGRVSPAAPGKQIRLQQFYKSAPDKPGAWHPLKWKYLTSQSTYDFGVKESAAGVYKFRVASPNGLSVAVDLPVYAWQYASNLPSLINNYDSIECRNVQQIDGELYPHACIMGSEWNAVDYYVIEWDLRRKCTTFDATIGFIDTTLDGARGNLKITDGLLGTLLYDHDFVVGVPQKVTLTNLAGRSRLKFTTLGLDADHSREWLGLGEPRLRCTWSLSS